MAPCLLLIPQFSSKHGAAIPSATNSRDFFNCLKILESTREGVVPLYSGTRKNADVGRTMLFLYIIREEVGNDGLIEVSINKPWSRNGSHQGNTTPKNQSGPRKINNLAARSSGASWTVNCAGNMAAGCAATSSVVQWYSTKKWSTS
jgi:hypothetical protein